MAYEVFERTDTRSTSPTLSVLADGRIALNAPAARLFLEAHVPAVALLWDKANLRIAVKAVPKGNKNAYAIFLAKTSGSVRSKQFLAHIGWAATRRVTVPAVWNEKDKMMEATLPAEHFVTAVQRIARSIWEGQASGRKTR
jgi:hypothetical protein